MKRRDMIQSAAAGFSAATLSPPSYAAPQDQRWRGVIGYFGEGNERTGSEYFSVSRHRGGGVTLRAVCEMYLEQDDLVRDTILSLDATNMPEQAYLKTVQHGAHVGSAWYRFAGKTVTADIQPPSKARHTLTRSFDASPDFFGTHSLVNDAWLARVLPAGQDKKTLPSLLSSSLAANGSGVPGLFITQAFISSLGPETITVAAGTFACTHYQVTYGDYPPLDMWVTGREYLLALMSWSHLSGRYELLSLAQT